MRTLVPAVIAALALLSGCGPDCQSTCGQLFDDPPACNIRPAGITDDSEISDLKRACVAQCQAALASPGEATYDPNERHGDQSAIKLITDKDAARWMDCVNETNCKDLDAGYCAPTKNF